MLHYIEFGIKWLGLWESPGQPFNLESFLIDDNSLTRVVFETNLLPFSKLKLIVVAKVNAFQLITKS